MEFGEIGILTALETPKLKHVASCVPMAQKLWNDLMVKVIDRPGDDMAIKTIALFHRVLLLTPTHSGVISMLNELKLVQEDNYWDLFTLGIFKIKRVQSTSNETGVVTDGVNDQGEFS